MVVRALIALGPRCFRCMLDIPSGPVAGEFLSFLMVQFVSCDVKGGGESVEVFVRMFCLVIVLF